MPTISAPAVSGDAALRTALQDAARAYREIHMYDILIKLQDDGWHVDFEFKDAAAQSGGPHYLIDSANGSILLKRYEQ